MNLSKINNTRIIVFLIAIGLSLVGCGKDDVGPKTPSSSINKIMSLGASRVEGNRPDHESFRYELWKKLVNNDWTFDYIGTQSDNASYPAVNGNEFDIDHEGRGGWTTGQIANGIEDWLADTGAPDIVLFSSPGGNDILQNLPIDEAFENINTIIDALQTLNPDITIIIEQFAPGRSGSFTANQNASLDQLHQNAINIAVQQSTSSSNVIAVDMFTGFTDSFLADEVHYNEAGAEFIAGQYYDVLVGVLDK